MRQAHRKEMIRMRTTKKEFTSQVQRHIIERLSTDETEIIREQLRNVVEDFYCWYSPFNKKQYPNSHNAFIEFLKCLPSSINIDFSDHDVHNTLKTWIENCGETYVTPKSQHEFDLYLHLITREFTKLTKRYLDDLGSDKNE